MLSQEIRRNFLQYFKNQKHTILPSSSVVPHEDPTLLFTNAGMNQFKDVFLGKSKRDYSRAATSQKCIRVGGKHNDLDNVGHTSRHLTFFEMLGNFSFGDYFKKEAIDFAWKISTEVFGFAPEKIWPTVFRNDDEAFELWTKYVSPEKITRFGEKENFWAMGDVGPCGPCSELLYDRGIEYGKAPNPMEDVDGERFLEFWNLVFMQYNRSQEGALHPLPKPSIDTGAGLERIIALKMGVDNVFETDILGGLISQIEKFSGISYNPGDSRAPAFNVIADHLRCLSFAIADGAQPSNVDRGYVLRKILRRAVRYGRTLGFEEPFLAKILPHLVSVMGDDYSELQKSQNRIAEILTSEEEAFFRTLRRGGNLLNQIVERADQHDRKIGGDDAFKLKDTYGLPFEEILLLAKDLNLQVDIERYQFLEQEAKERSRKGQKATQQIAGENLYAHFEREQGPTKFLGYTQSSSVSKILGLVVNNEFVEKIEPGQEAAVILDQTSFYAEMGGQVGDTGKLEGPHQYFQVNDTKSPYKGIIVQIGVLREGVLSLGDLITATIDEERRQKIADNHTATHLLHWALHQVLGEHIKQAGSVVDPERLRFDFSHHKPLSEQEIRQIEDLVNAKIRENASVKWYEITYEEAQKKAEIKQFFGDKYGAKVRVIDIEFSKELCGGTHTSSVGNIGLFLIAKEGSIAAGIRRIEAVTGQEAIDFSRKSENVLNELATQLKTQPGKIQERITKLLEENQKQEKELQIVKEVERKKQIERLLKKTSIVQGITLVAEKIDVAPDQLKTYAEDLLQQLGSSCIVLGTVSPDKCHLFVRVSEDLVDKGIKANELIKMLSPMIEGSGGGKPNAAQAGGKAIHSLEKALSEVKNLIKIP